LDKREKLAEVVEKPCSHEGSREPNRTKIHQMKTTLDNMTLPAVLSYDNGGDYHDDQRQMISVLITDAESPILFFDHVRGIPGTVQPLTPPAPWVTERVISPRVITSHVRGCYVGGNYEAISPDEFNNAVEETCIEELTENGQLIDHRGQCEWFAKCLHPATRSVSHPVLHHVPCCEICASRASR
jgi:hypothetical protein